MEIKLKNSNDNPFYGCRECLKLFQTPSMVDDSILEKCWNEVKDDKVKREMFFSLLFSIGDITNRQHNIFKGQKIDGGGNAERAAFEKVFNWLRDKHYDQFLQFLNAGLFNEYTCFDLLFKNRVQTKGAKVLNVYSSFEDKQYCEDLANYLYKVINGKNLFDKLLVAKFLTLPRLSKRKGHKKMLDATRTIMEHKVAFLQRLSALMGWDFALGKNYANFAGYRKWRQLYNGELESVLFSTGKINEFDELTFTKWLNTLPAQARFRVKNRVTYPKKETGEYKYPKLKTWFENWEKLKEAKQQEQRVLEEKVRQGQASVEDKAKLEKVKKEAKVTTGAVTFKDLYKDILRGNVDKLKLESFINKVNLPYNSLVIIDDSGSMTGAPFNFASFIAAVCLVKNPDDNGRNLLGFFDDESRWYSYIDKELMERPNSFMRRCVAQCVTKPFVDPLLSFYDNYKRISNFCQAVFNGGCTHINSIPENLHRKCQENPELLDHLKNYPIWTILSDGEWNSLASPEASMNDFMMRCEKYFGYRPFIVAIDIFEYGYQPKADRFAGIENMIYIPSNPAQIEQFLTNFNDMDRFDVYTPLQSLYRSNRYELVRQSVL